MFSNDCVVHDLVFIDTYDQRTAARQIMVWIETKIAKSCFEDIDDLLLNIDLVLSYATLTAVLRSSYRVRDKLPSYPKFFLRVSTAFILCGRRKLLIGLMR